MGNTISGNYIGVDASGTFALGNAAAGIVIESGAQRNVLGGITAGERNIIGGNNRPGVQIYDTGTVSNIVIGNYIGTDVNGTTAIPNDGDGVSIGDGASYNLIGGDTESERNVISGNDGSGVNINGTMSNTVSGNYIGTDANGTAAISNNGDGVSIGDGASYNLIGGDAEGEGNVITFNKGDGINIETGMTNTVSGNLIGLDLDGTRDIRVQAMAISPNYASDQTLFIGTEYHGVWKTTDEGSSWAMVSSGLTISDVLSLTISPNYGADGTIFAGTTEGGIFKSTDEGGFWIKVDGGVTGADISTLAISPDYVSDGIIFAGAGGGGVFASTDGGDNWGARNNGLTSWSIWDLVISSNFATDETIFVGTEDTKVFKSTDRGSNWIDVSGGWTEGDVAALAISPNYGSDQTIFAVTSEVFKSVDGGSSWNSAGGAPGWGALFLAISPNYTVDQTLFAGDEWGGIYRSTDGGINWVQTLTGYSHYWRAIAISPAYASDQTLFVGTSTDGVLKSVDSGSTWIEVSGLTERGNYGNGVSISDGAQWNVIGGGSAGERNVISNNGYYGISISSSATNTVSGNYIGTDATGSATLGNGMGGVDIEDGAQRNVIGGTTAGERNIISGNSTNHCGVCISGAGADHNRVSSNYIGTDVSGTIAKGNGGEGIWIWGGASYNTIGGPTEGERNLISGNGAGVAVWDTGTVSNTVAGNYIGTDASGTIAIPNGSGVSIRNGASYNLIGGNSATPGGACSGECNLISGNRWNGVDIQHTGTMGNVVSGNYIGTDATGTAAIPNNDNGVFIKNGASYNLIGGDTPGERNVISGNGDDGVSMHGSGTMSNTVSGFTTGHFLTSEASRS
jgi:photosystem II stability/assembly factor-like uncharacterized protein